MTEQEIKQMEDRANAATPGPWVYEFASREYYFSVADEATKTQLATVNYYRETDAPFIAHARTDIPNLIAEVKRLKALIKQVEYACYEANDIDIYCPWCERHLGLEHDSDCPAFNPDGSVK